MLTVTVVTFFKVLHIDIHFRENKSSAENVIRRSYREVRSMMFKDFPNVRLKLERDVSNVTFDYTITRFYLHQNLLYLVFSSSDTIAVYTYNNFSLWYTIKLQYLSQPRSIHPHTEHHLLVASYNGLLRMTTEGQDVEVISSGHFTDVNVNGDIIAALSGGRVLIYTNAIPIKSVTSFKIIWTNSIFIVGDLLYTSGYATIFKFMRNFHIMIYNMTGGKIIGKHKDPNGHKISTGGYFNVPNILAWDKERTVLILDTYGQERKMGYFKRIKTLDRYGKWKMIPTLNQKHFDILDIIITDNRQVVVMHKNKAGGIGFSVLKILSVY